MKAILLIAPMLRISASYTSQIILGEIKTYFYANSGKKIKQFSGLWPAMRLRIG